ncbi:aspartyl-tRNA synthetase, partial [Trifolium medium]|nr:aspartyl-tRNA synthetase [Trifolium medium]
KRVPFFNGDASTFNRWKSRIYSHVNGIDDELWDLVEEGVKIENLDDDGKLTITRKKALLVADRKIYNKHHKVRDIIIGAITNDEYERITDKSTAKHMYDSLCSTYDGNEQIQEAKAALLVQQYDLFIMKEDEDIETMFT